MIKKWILMKRKEIELKLKIYSYTIEYINKKQEMFTVLSRVYNSLRDTPVEDMQEKLIHEIAQLVHSGTSNK